MLKQCKILMIATDLYEDLELHYPKLRMIEAGAEVVVATPKKEHEYKGAHGYPLKGDMTIQDVNPEGFSALIIPGGYSPDALRMNPKVQEIVRHFHEQEKVIAFICHAGWIPLSAGVLKGVRCTSYHTIKDDLINGGAKWEEAQVVIDRHFISSRFPADLPYFCPAIVEQLEKKGLAARI